MVVSAFAFGLHRPHSPSLQAVGTMDVDYIVRPHVGKRVLSVPPV